MFLILGLALISTACQTQENDNQKRGGRCSQRRYDSEYSNNRNDGSNANNGEYDSTQDSISPRDQNGRNATRAIMNGTGSTNSANKSSY